MQIPEMYKGIPFSPQVALSDNIGAADTVIPVSDISAFPDAPNLATIGTDEDGETILYAAKTANALSGCTRGVEGTAKAWRAGETIARNFTNADYAALIENIKKHGHTASAVMYGNKPLDEVLADIEETLENGVVTDRAIQNVPSQYGSITYDGQEHSPTWNGFDPSALLIGGVKEATEAGTYETLFTPKQGYYWASDGSSDTITVPWTIERKPVGAITQTNSLTYTGAQQAPSWEGIQPSIMTLGGDQSGTNAGTYTMTVLLDNNYQWPDGSNGLLNLQWEIARASVSLIPSVSATMTYTGSAQSPQWANYDSAKLSISGDTSGTNAGNYTTKFTPTSNYKWSDGSVAAKSVTWSIGKANGSLSISASNLTVEGSGTFTVTRAGDGVISVSSSNTNIATATVNGTTVTVTGKAAGSATITVKVAEGTNYKAPADKTCAVTVVIKPVAKTSATAGVSYTSGLSGITQSELSEYAEAISKNSAITKTTSTVYLDKGSTHIKLSTGDTVSISVSGTSYLFRITGFNHDELTTKTAYGAATATGKAGISFQMVDCLNTTEQMNSSNTNSGGWGSSAFRAKLQSTIKNSMPAAWTSIIKKVNKKTSAGNQSSTINTTSDDLFLYSEVEIFGSTTYSFAGEGEQYAYWAANNNTNARIKKVNGSAYSWWERSPCASGATGFCSVGSGGGASYFDASLSRGVAFGFCV